ncbi:hypothetical protein GJ496_009354 [Pomphorhynchus laevis]|nr:hypothetical protein GJ496_009354 [Pomphorhynchus laevis]
MFVKMSSTIKRENLARKKADHVISHIRFSFFFSVSECIVWGESEAALNASQSAMSVLLFVQVAALTNRLSKSPRRNMHARNLPTLHRTLFRDINYFLGKSDPESALVAGIRINWACLMC